MRKLLLETHVYYKHKVIRHIISAHKGNYVIRLIIDIGFHVEKCNYVTDDFFQNILLHAQNVCAV